MDKCLFSATGKPLTSVLERKVVVFFVKKERRGFVYFIFLASVHDFVFLFSIHMSIVL